MSKKIFVNLPVADLPRSIAFYERLGARKDGRFSDETGACLTFSDAIHVMLLTHEKYRQFTPKPIADAKVTSAALLCLSCDSREAVDAMAEAAKAGGGLIDPAPVQDHGVMYGRSFEDPDGHGWEPMWMDLDAFLSMQRQAAA